MEYEKQVQILIVLAHKIKQNERLASEIIAEMIDEAPACNYDSYEARLEIVHGNIKVLFAMIRNLLEKEVMQ